MLPKLAEGEATKLILIPSDAMQSLGAIAVGGAAFQTGQDTAGEQQQAAVTGEALQAVRGNETPPLALEAMRRAGAAGFTRSSLPEVGRLLATLTAARPAGASPRPARDTASGPPGS